MQTHHKIPDAYIHDSTMAVANFKKALAKSDQPRELHVLVHGTNFFTCVKDTAGAPANNANNQWEWPHDRVQVIFIPPGHDVYIRRGSNKNGRGTGRVYNL